MLLDEVKKASFSALKSLGEVSSKWGLIMQPKWPQFEGFPVFSFVTWPATYRIPLWPSFVKFLKATEGAELGSEGNNRRKGYNRCLLV